MQELLTREQLVQHLRVDALDSALGLLTLAVGVAALVLYRLRTRAKDPSLIWFGLFCALYGVRLLLQADLVRYTAGISALNGRFLVAAITYVIPLPAMFFAREVFPAWRAQVRWIISLQVAFAVVAITCDLGLRRPFSLDAINSIFVLASTAAFLIALFRGTGTATERVLRIGILVFVATIVASNFRAFGLLAGSFNWEPLGFLVFMGSLGLVIARRIAQNEQRLASIEKELEIARRIQTSILPCELPRSPRLHVSARYLPMTAVAGDFYDFLVVDECRVGILVADVSGHGVPAALIASMVKVAIAAQLPHADDPARVLTGMNEILCGKLQGQFVTAAYLFLDLESGRMRYSAAGHPPLLWWRAGSRRVETLEQNGLLLGLFARASYSSRDEKIRKGDRFLLYTDGIVEATNGTEEFFGTERLCSALAESVKMDAVEAATSVLNKLSAWSSRDGKNTGDAQEDDVTLVCVDVCAEASPLALSA